MGAQYTSIAQEVVADLRWPDLTTVPSWDPQVLVVERVLRRRLGEPATGAGENATPARTQVDAINAAFESGGAILLLLNVWAIVRDGSLAGVHWLPTAWFTVWGLWNLHYYRTLGQRRSWVAGAGVVLANAAWLGLVAWMALR